MRVAAQGEETARVKGNAVQPEVHILSRRIAVNLDRNTSLGRHSKNTRPIRRHAGPRSKHAAAPMPQDPDLWIRHDRKHPAGLVLERTQYRMWRGDDEFEQAEFFRRHVEGAVGPDVGLDAFDDAKPVRVS